MPRFFFSIFDVFSEKLTVVRGNLPKYIQKTLNTNRFLLVLSLKFERIYFQMQFLQ